MPHLLLAVLLLALVSPSSYAAEPGDKLSALAIFDRGLAQFESNRAALSKWQYYQTLTTHQLDSAGNVVAKGTWHSIVRPGDPQPLEYTSKSVEGRISFFQEGANESAAAPATTPSKRNAGVEKNQSEAAVEAVHKYRLRDRYLWKRLADETLNGEAAYVLSFEPKLSQRSTSREERFFGLLAGRLWVSRDDFTVLKAQAALQSPCQLFWILARVTTFQMNYELTPGYTGNRLLRLSKASAKTVVKFPFFAIRQRHWQTVDKYEPRTPRGSTSPR